MGIGDFISDVTPDVVEDAVEDATEWAGDRVEDAGDWTADRLDDAGWESGADWVREQSRSLANRMGAQVDEMDLGQTEDKTKLVYGSADKLRATAQNLRDMEGSFTSVGKGLQGLDSQRLKGQAADAFRETVSIEPPRWFKASEAFRKASGALEIFADTVEWAQAQAQRAIDKWKEGQRASDGYEDKVNAYNDAVDRYNAQPPESRNPASLPPNPGSSNPGIPLMREAQEILDEARRQRNAEAQTATTAVEEGLAAAPPKPSYGEQAMDGLAEIPVMNAHFVGGAIKGTIGLTNFVRQLNPTDPYNITHPAEYLLNLNNTVAGVVRAVNDPWGTGKVMLDQFMKDPSEGLGRLVPDVILTIATAGGGAGVKAARVADEAADAARVRKGLDELPPGTRLRPDGTRTTTATDPVDLASGRMFLAQTDVSLPGALPLDFTRRVESGYDCGRFFGPSWSSTVDERLIVDPVGVVHVTPDGLTVPYPHPVPGTPTRPEGAAGGLLERTADGDYTLTDAGTGVVRRFAAPVDATDEDAPAHPGKDTPAPEPGGDGTAWLVETADRNGHTVTVDRAPDGTPAAVVHSAGHQLTLTTAEGLITGLALAGAGPDGTDLTLVTYGYTGTDLTTVTKNSGGVLAFAYDERHRITSWTDSGGRRYDYVYDDRDRVVAEGGEAGHVQVTIAYGEPDADTGHRVTELTTPAGHSTRYLVDDRCQIIAVTDPLDHTTGFTHDARGRLLSRTDALGATTSYTLDEEGRPTALVRPDGSVLSTRYNALGLPEEFTAPDGGRWSQEFDARGNPVAVTDPAGHTTRYRYDDLGHVTEITAPDGQVTTVRCDAAGLPVESADPLGHVTRYERDAFGRPATITGPDGSVTRLRWTPEGELAARTDPDGAESTWEYDGEGNCVAATDPLGLTTRHEYTHFDLPLARVQPDGRRFEFGHDDQLRLTSVTNPQGLTWSYEYDAAGRLVAETDFDGRTVRYELDAAGRLAARTGPAGDVVRFEHDALGQVVRKDAAGDVTTYDYDSCGRLVQAAGPDAELVRQYDKRGLLKTELVAGRAVTFRYDAMGRRIRRTTPGGARTDYTYDAAGRCTGITAGGRRLEFAHDAAGRELTRQFGEAVTLSSEWDVAGRLTGTELTAGDRRPLRRRYRYRADGSLAALDDSLGGSRRFTLDTGGRVTAVTAEGWTESYAYDDAGNQTAAAWPASHPGTDATGDRDYAGTRIVRAGATTYRHDDAGRLVRRTRTRLSRKPDVWHYRYDAEGRLSAVTTPDGARWRYRYDPLGRRVAKQRVAEDGGVLEQTDFTWDGDLLAEQTTSVPGRLPHPVVTTWDHRGPHPVAQTERRTDAATQREIDSRFFAIATDLIGTPTELVDEQGGIAWRTRSTLWGSTTWNADATAYTPLRFPGHYYDPETGLHYNHHRYYDPQTARYTTPDPLGLAPAPNPVTYVHNPLTWSDPLGLSPCARGAWQQRADFTSQSTMSKKYDAHAGDFIDSPGNRNKQTLAQFEQAMRDHMVAPDTKIYRFDYRGQGTAVGFIDPNTMKMVMLRSDGSFWTAYKLGDNQFRDIVDNGHLW